MTGVVPPIFTPEEWTEIQVVLDRRSSGATPTVGGRPRLLSGIARCALCGAPLQASGSSPKLGKRYRAYRCSGWDCADPKRHACPGVSAVADRLEPAVLSAVKESLGAFRADRTGILAEVRALLADDSRPPDVAKLERDRQALLDRAARRALAAESDELAARITAQAKEEARRLEVEIDRGRTQATHAKNLEDVLSRAFERASALEAADTTEGNEALREVLRGFIARLEVGPGPMRHPKPVELDVYTLPGYVARDVTGPPGSVGGAAPRERWSKIPPMKQAVCLVTGAGRGIGAAVALELAARGARVVLASRSEGELTQVAVKIAEDGGTALPVRADVSDEAQVQRLFREARERFGPITHLVNNAGTVVPGPCVEATLAGYRENLDANLTSTFLCCREALRDMVPARRGRIVNVSSVSGVSGVPKLAGFTSYAAAKAAVIAFTEALAAEVGPTGVRVLCVSPGSTDTRLFARVAPGVTPDLTPVQVARVIVTALSDDLAPANGANLVVWGR